MDSAREIGRTSEGNKESNENQPPKSGVSSDMCSNAVNKTPPTKVLDSYWFAHSGDGESSPANASKTPNDLKDAQQQKEKEEKIKQFREQQEGERVKRLKELEQSFVLAKLYREQQEEERRVKIEAARVREMERRQQVEERKRQIWEAEQERKEAILRRNMEREARIEARRNAQRNSQCFAFGSSTPRTFDLDLAAIGLGRNVSQGSVLMSSVSGRRSEERDLGPPRATSACSLDRKCGEDYMSRSMVSLSSTFRGRRRTDITPTPTRDRSATPHSTTPRGNHCLRAVSMTRLDQLAQPRRTYLNAIKGYPVTTTNNGGPGTVSPSMSKSMCNLANPTVKKPHPPLSSRNPTRGNMSRSMLHLAETSTTQKDSRRFTPSPTLPPKPMMRSARSMVHLAPVPRLTRAARLRAVAGANAKSAWNLSKPEESPMAGQFLTPLGKDTSRSPSRPQSAMSGTSEISATSSSISAVNMRPRTAPRRPRPFSIAGCAVDTPATAPSSASETERQPRLAERNVSPPKPSRAKSSGREKDTNIKPISVSKKPVPPPKSSEVLARAKIHNVPTKDNLRKVPKTSADKSSVNINMKEPLKSKEHGTEQIIRVSEFSTDQTKISHENSKPQSDDLKEPVIEIEVKKSPTRESVALAPGSESIKNSQTISDANLNAGIESIDTRQSVSKLQNDITIELVEISNGVDTKLKISDTDDSNKVEKNKIKIEQKDTQSNVTVLQTDVSNGEVSGKETTSGKTRITSEEEAKAALAEKRRLAREQAEREAELERQQQEELKRKEEEQKRLEEEEQQRMEAEQIRLAELHRQLEEEKLQKAIEEQEQREKEERERKEEESRLKAEREEQERKAREEAEKQRIELEERLRKEEEERAERKKRVEQIMARTRNKSQAANNPQDSPQIEVKGKSESFGNVSSYNTDPNDNPKVSPNTENVSPIKVESSAIGVSATGSQVTNSGSVLLPSDVSLSERGPLPDLLNSEHYVNNSHIENGHHVENGVNSSVFNNFTSSSQRNGSSNHATSPSQTNGYSSHEEMSCTTSPEDVSDSPVLINVGSHNHLSGKAPTSQSAEYTMLVDFEETTSTTNCNNENNLINVDNINSNVKNSASPLIEFDDSVQKKQETTVTDLLS